MIKLISLDGGKLSLELVNNKIISFVPIVVIEK